MKLSTLKGESWREIEREGNGIAKKYVCKTRVLKREIVNNPANLSLISEKRFKPKIISRKTYREDSKLDFSDVRRIWTVRKSVAWQLQSQFSSFIKLGGEGKTRLPFSLSVSPLALNTPRIFSPEISVISRKGKFVIEFPRRFIDGKRS